jgi:hypothetical protein
MSDSEILAIYYRIEAELGGAGHAKEALRRTAAEAGVSYERARNVVLNDWGAGAAG